MYTQNHGKTAEPDTGVPVPPPDYGGNLTFSGAPDAAEPVPEIEKEKEKEKPRETADRSVSVFPRFWDNVSAEDLLLLGAVLFLLFSGQNESLLMPLVLVAAVLL